MQVNFGWQHFNFIFIWDLQLVTGKDVRTLSCNRE
jgi:hypothetical protein